MMGMNGYERMLAAQLGDHLEIVRELSDEIKQLNSRLALYEGKDEYDGREIYRLRLALSAVLMRISGTVAQDWAARPGDEPYKGGLSAYIEGVLRETSSQGKEIKS